MTKFIVNLIILMCSFGLLLAKNSFAEQNNLRHPAEVADEFESGRELSVSSGKFCSAPKIDKETSSEINVWGTYFILNDFEKPGSPIPSVTLSVVKSESGAKVIFHATKDSDDARVFADAVGPFTGSISPCEDFDKLWTQKLILREVTAIAFDGVDIISGPNGPDFRMRGKGNP